MLNWAHLLMWAQGVFVLIRSGNEGQAAWAVAHVLKLFQGHHEGELNEGLLSRLSAGVLHSLKCRCTVALAAHFRSLWASLFFLAFGIQRVL